MDDRINTCGALSRIVHMFVSHTYFHRSSLYVTSGTFRLWQLSHMRVKYRSCSTTLECWKKRHRVKWTHRSVSESSRSVFLEWQFSGLFLQSWLCFCVQWENHNKSLQLEAQTYQRIQEKIQERVMNNLGTWIDWQYMQNAAKLLAKVLRSHAKRT